MLIKEIARELEARLDGDGAIEIDRVVHPARAERPSDLALAVGGDAAAALAQTKARAVLVANGKTALKRSFQAILTVADPRIALARLTALFDPGPVHSAGVHPTALIAPDAELAQDVSVGAFVVIGPRSQIGAGTVILSHVTIGAGVRVKKPGAKMVATMTELAAVKSSPGDEVDAYERLLTDAMKGDALLFVREDAVEVTWAVVEPILGNVDPLHFYEPGSWGPPEAANLAKDVGGWRDPT